MSENKTKNNDKSVDKKAKEAAAEKEGTKEMIEDEELEEQETNGPEQGQRDDEAEEQEEQEEEMSETEALEEELSKEKDRYMRLRAEYENYRRRTSRERNEMQKTAGQDVVQALLPVLDDFDRAIGEVEKSADKEHLKGMELINSKLRDTLDKKGLEEMKVKQGDKFDADLHEAVSQIPAPKKKLKNKIVDVVEKGYTMGDKIIRFPKVVTGK